MKNLFLILVIFPTYIFSQGWEKKYGGEYNVGHSVQQTTDGGYIIVGYTKYGFDDGDVYLIKTNGNGDTLWTKTFGGDGMDNGMSIQQTADDGYIICGGTKSIDNEGFDVYLIKTNNKGDTLWTKTFDGDGSEFGMSVKQTTDGAFIVAGYTNYAFDDGDVYLIKTNGNGDTLWTKTYYIEGINMAHSVQQTTDNGYIICGYTRSYYNTNEYALLIKTDSNGDTLWTKKYVSELSIKGHSVQQTIDGGYIVTGTTYSFENNSEDIYLIKTDVNGDKLWTKIYGGDLDDEGWSVSQTTDNGFIICGYTGSFGNGDDDVYLIKTDSNGDTLWTKTFGGVDTEHAYSVQQTSDDGYIITGYTRSNVILNRMVYLIKTDKSGSVLSTAEIPIPNPSRKLIRLINLSGKEIVKPKSNQPYIEIYDDGTTRKKIKIK